METIKTIDFLPDRMERKSIFGGYDTGDFDSSVAAMNEWLVHNRVEVISIETVTLPNIYEDFEEGSHDAELHSRSYTVWYQFTRLWYREN